jgi:hypothetical protein
MIEDNTQRGLRSRVVSLGRLVAPCWDQSQHNLPGGTDNNSHTKRPITGM